jgi:hypothetical protein
LAAQLSAAWSATKSRPPTDFRSLAAMPAHCQ